MGLLTTLDISAEQDSRPRARDLSSRLKIEGYLRARWGTHDNFFTSDILIITLLSNFLLQYVESKLGLGLSPSRQTVIRYNDSTVIRCYVRPYSPHYAPSLVLSNVPYFRSVCSVAIPSPNLLSTCTVEGSWILLSYSRLPSSNRNLPFALCALNAAISRGDAPRE